MRSRPTRPAAVWTLLFVSALLAPACQTAPGGEKAITAAERALQVSDGAYATAMQWYFMPGNAQRLTVQQRDAFEKLRTSYDPAYRAVQNGITALKAGKQKDLTKELASLQAMITDVDAVIGVYIRPMSNVP